MKGIKILCDDYAICMCIHIRTYVNTNIHLSLFDFFFSFIYFSLSPPQKISFSFCWLRCHLWLFGLPTNSYTAPRHSLCYLQSPRSAGIPSMLALCVSSILVYPLAVPICLERSHYTGTRQFTFKGLRGSEELTIQASSWTQSTYFFLSFYAPPLPQPCLWVCCGALQVGLRCGWLAVNCVNCVREYMKYARISI